MKATSGCTHSKMAARWQRYECIPKIIQKAYKSKNSVKFFWLLLKGTARMNRHRYKIGLKRSQTHRIMQQIYPS